MAGYSLQTTSSGILLYPCKFRGLHRSFKAYVFWVWNIGKKKKFIYKGTELTAITVLNSCDRKKNSILIYKVDK